MSLAAAYMVHKITITRLSGEPDIEGNLPTQTWEDQPARVEYGNRLIRTASGEQKPSRASLITSFAVKVGDTITLPDGASQAAMDVRPISGLGGAISHYEVYL